jgi:ferredoxin-NADP reductase/Na+-transporting NADH:ubiquinone oxidoreductase subunit NqrB
MTTAAPTAQVSAPVRVRTWLDTVTGRVTMYRLVVICLVVLLVAAMVVSFAGQIFYTPVEIAVSAVVAVGATLVTGVLFARLFRTRAHLESSVITGLLLMFLFRPTTDPLELSTIALAALIASASKYLLAIRRRHLFNPAAIGALVVSLTQLNFAAWWVATPSLLPFTAATALLILYRTHRLRMGLTFIAIAAALVTFSNTSGDTSIPDALGLALTSYPIVFLAGFMLSEPLTLPPRRWQQLALAAIVAVLMWVPFSFGPVYNSPELALVVGNLFAFVMGQRRGIHLTFRGRTQLTPTSWEFEFEPQRPLSFVPGQYMELTVPHRGADPRGVRRVFSIASAPGDSVRFGLRVPEVSSSFKRALLELQVDDTVAATSIGGDFVLPKNPARPLLLVAGGIGVTPFIAQLAHLEATGQKRDAVLVYSSSRVDEIAYAERLERGEHRVLLVSPTAPETLPASWTWIGPGPLTGDMLLAAVPDATKRDAFVSGPPQLVGALKQALRRAGVRRVKSDYFSGY